MRTYPGVFADDLGTMVAHAAAAVPSRTAIATRQGAIRTYADLEARTNRLASALLASGLAHGDRVLAWMDDSLEYLELYVAVVKAGLVVVPVNRLHTVAEAQFPARDSGARAFFFSADLADKALELVESQDFNLVVAVGGQFEGCEGFEALLSRGADRRLEPVDPDSLAVIGYTSGTTGRPKGAMLTHRSIKAIARMNALAYRLPLGSVCAFSGSMSFTATVTGHYFLHLYVHGTTVLMGRWEVDELLDTIDRFGAQFTYVPAPRLVEFAEAAERRPEQLKTLVSLLHSASKASPDDLRRVADVIGDRLVEGLGMTENSGGLVTATVRADYSEPCAALDLFASVGRPIPDAMVRVLDADGQPLPHDGEAVGELVMSTPALMRGYWQNTAATEATLKDGWYYSSDLGSIDPAGYVYVSDRRTDLIVSGGMNVYPSEVEQVIVGHPGVQDVAVVGEPHERWGQTVVAVIVRAEGSTVTSDDVIAYTRERIASYKKPTRVVFVDSLPLTTSLKIKRHEVRELVSAQGETT